MRRVWIDYPDTVLISSPGQFIRLTNGEEALSPVGFPRADVFRHNSDIEAMLKAGNVRWDKLTPY